MAESIKFVVNGESAGTIEVIIDNTSSELTATFIYKPNPETPIPKEMLLGYRDSSGKGHMILMTEDSGQWIAKRCIEPNESSDFFMHPDVKPGELHQKPNIINKIALSDGKIVISVYENPELNKKNKGSMQNRVLNAEGILSEPVDKSYQSGSGEQLVEVYFPAGYGAAPKEYGMQVMLDGDMHLHQDAFGNRMGTMDILDNLIAEGKMEPIIAVFVSPTQPTMEMGKWVSMPRLKEYGCDLQTDAMLTKIPEALRQAGISVTRDLQKIGLCGQSMGGLQALYTAKMHPDIYGLVIAQSPAVWWGPSSLRLSGEESTVPVRYEDDQTWRAPLANKEEQRYLLHMIQTGYDALSNREVPKGEPHIYLQAGILETGDCGLGDEPLTQATLSLAQELHVECRLHNGGHTAESWATGLAVQLPQAHPRLTALKENQLDSVPKTEAGAIDLTKAERIAEGGTHVLYRFSEAPFVIKVMKQNPNPKDLEELEKKYAVLYECFDKDGKQRCIRENHIILPVQLPGKDPQNAALSIVPYEKCFKSKVKFDFKIEPAELDPYLMEHNKELFGKAHKALIHKNDSESSFDLNDYPFIDERIGAILQRLDSDPTLRDVMIEFLTHYRDFYQKTGIIMDAMGFENILFFKDEYDDWQFKVGSVIKHDTGKYTNELFDALRHERKVDLDSFVNFTHAYFSPANIRAVNVCAMKLNLDPVIYDVIIDAHDLFKISLALSIPERMLAYARHGDFEKMKQILHEYKGELCFSHKDFWAYSLIADEYIKHAQTPEALQTYLYIVSQLPVIFPENKEDAQRVQDAKKALIERNNVHSKKIALHEELTKSVPDFKFRNRVSMPPREKTNNTESVTHNYKKQLQQTKTDDLHDTQRFILEQ
ncbi:alpha/beta hydrolase [Legionella parisiensis]|uniref:Endo-1,4-beta-xylanase Y n=1 Tax=Legionella parisiensis TaxID=45071 RepID=A0A1E5JNH0_9GAMM|nr:alpha/beta hydrolase-fold protein [Legionella parisiensis]KTD44349.1 Endo-1,4-beta-xylanase Y precursor [Legionella parisiensis]OEH45893.1 Endo-1,4-beta-xylanase Y [Legionella parisiensis]STX71975.1 Endo-1,4-beta-xylanase Y precursor [Legionella parisiensis]